MSHSVTQELNDGNRCWICLCGGDEVPPLGTPKDASNWVKPCSCSLIAHQKCLINWILSMDTSKRRRLLEEMERLPPPQRTFRGDILRVIGINAGREDLVQSILPTFFDRADLTLCVPCPQCSSMLYLKNSRDNFINLVQLLEEYLWSATRFLFFSTLISTSIASALASICATLSGAGIQILNTICPESVLMKLVNIPARSLGDALNRNLLTGRFFVITTLLPIYIGVFRLGPQESSITQETFIQFYPLLFLNKMGDLNSQPGARQALFILSSSRYLYNLLFSLTFNRVYYRWVKSLSPSVIANRLSIKELDKIQEENEEEYELELESELANKGEQSVWQTILGYFAINSKLEKLKRSRRRRELENCLKYDYSFVFNKSRPFFFVSTLLWPLLGERFSTHILSKSKYLLKLLNKFAKTPDQATFFRNLVGCCCIVLLKDIINLYLAWRRMRQFKNTRVVEFGTDEWNEDTAVSMAYTELMREQI